MTLDGVQAKLQRLKEKRAKLVAKQENAKDAKKAQVAAAIIVVDEKIAKVAQRLAESAKPAE